MIDLLLIILLSVIVWFYAKSKALVPFRWLMRYMTGVFLLWMATIMTVQSFVGLYDLLLENATYAIAAQFVSIGGQIVVFFIVVAWMNKTEAVNKVEEEEEEEQEPEKPDLSYFR